eukprot:3241105-Rhodomonas_salina.1
MRHFVFSAFDFAVLEFDFAAVCRDGQMRPPRASCTPSACHVTMHALPQYRTLRSDAVGP